MQNEQNLVVKFVRVLYKFIHICDFTVSILHLYVSFEQLSKLWYFKLKISKQNWKVKKANIAVTYLWVWLKHNRVTGWTLPHPSETKKKFHGIVTRGALLDDEATNFARMFRAGFWVGFGPNDEDVGQRTVGDPILAAVQRVGFAFGVVHSFSLHTCWGVKYILRVAIIEKIEIVCDKLKCCFRHKTL